MNDNREHTSAACSDAGAGGGQIGANGEQEATSPRQRELPPAAQRALAEAEARRKAADAQESEKPAEVGGRDGPDPVRYGDWEKGGIISDF